MTENSSGSFTAMSFGSMIDGMFTSWAMFLAYSIRWSPRTLPLASFMSMKSGSSLLISSHSVSPPFPSQLKFLSLCSRAFELTRSRSAVFDQFPLFCEIWSFRTSVHSRSRISFRTPSTMFCARC